MNTSKIQAAAAAILANPATFTSQVAQYMEAGEDRERQAVAVMANCHGDAQERMKEASSLQDCNRSAKVAERAALTAYDAA